MSSKREQSLIEIADNDCRPLPATMAQENVAYAFNHYHLISAPVVSETGRLVGVVTIDDAMAVLDDEAEEDILLLAGVGAESLYDRVLSTARQRFPWLIVNLAAAIAASAVINSVCRNHRNDGCIGGPDANRCVHGRQCRNSIACRRRSCLGHQGSDLLKCLADHPPGIFGRNCQRSGICSNHGGDWRNLVFFSDFSGRLWPLR